MDKKIKTTTAAPAISSGEHVNSLSPVDSSKVSPPRSSARLVPREKLHGLLQDARRRRCIVIKGPAGCGKTTALVAWRQMLLPLGFDVAWLTLTSDDNQLARFLDYLLASLAQVDPALVRDALLVEGYSSDNEAVERTIITLVRGIGSHPRELVLVLDDLHTLTDVAIHQALQWLIEYAPNNLHVVLVSRSVVPLSLARLRSQNLTMELDLRDLRFTYDEAQQFLTAHLGEISPQEVQVIYDMTDGWVAGLQLVAVSRKKSRQRPSLTTPDPATTQAHLRDNESFAHFFEAQVLAQLSVPDLDLLLNCTVCNRFSASLCAALVGRPLAVSEARALLERLENDNLFLIPIESHDDEGWYRLHPLLRETLLKLFSQRSSEEQQRVHARAWQWFRDRGQLSDAVMHAVQGGEAVAAAELVEQQVERLYAQGDLRLLIELVKLLPMEQLQASINLRVLLTRMQIYTREFAACSDNIRRLQHDIPEGNNEERFRLTMVRALFAVQRDDTDGALAIAPELLDPPPGADVIMVGGSINILSWLYMQRGEHERARQLQFDRPPLMVNGMPLVGTTGGTLQGRCLVGLSLAMEGQMSQAERIYREVIYEAERSGKTCAEPLYFAKALLGEVLYENNEVEAAYELLARSVDIFERVSIPDSVLRVLEVLAKCQWTLGNHREAFAYLERLEEYARKLDLPRLQAHSLARQIFWHLQLGEQVAAETQLARLDVLDARHPNSERSALGDIRILTEHAHVRWLAAQGDTQGAQLRLNKVIALCESGGRKLGIPRLTLLSALFDTQRGQLDTAQEKVLAVLRVGHRYGQVRNLLDADPTALELISDIARRTELDPVLAFYVERLLATQRAPAPPPPAPSKAGWQLAPGMEPLSERELEVLRLLAQALPNKKIARALGLSHETVKWHLRHIYSKLGVSSRDEAVARLRDLEASSES